MTDREALQIAFNALVEIDRETPYPIAKHTIKCINAAFNTQAQPEQVAMKQGWDVDTLLAQPEQEPVDRETLIECIAGAISTHMTVKLYPSEVLAAAEYIADNYNAPLSKQEPVEYDAPALYKAKAEREKDPLCWLKETGSIGGGYEQTAWGDTSGFPVFTAPASKPWVDLSDDDTEALIWDLGEWSRYVEVDTAPRSLMDHVRQVLAALRSKNT